MTERDEILSQLKADNPSWGRHRLSKVSGIPEATVQRWLKKQVSKQFDIEDGYKLKGRSTLYGADGEVKAQWVKTCEDREKTLELLQCAVEEVIEPAKGKHKPTAGPKHSRSELLVAYPIADAHVGLYAWEDETGENWDTGKAEDAITQGFNYLVDAAPDAETALIANLADYFHTDTDSNVTARSGHTLDVDTRRAKVFQVGAKIYRNAISKALEKHKKVIVNSAIGNHDDHSILALAMLMQAYFCNEPRVTVNLPKAFQYHRFGNSLIGITHGEVKPDKLPGIMASDCREEWGASKYGYWYTGHIHHKTVHEFPGCVVESFRTPGAKDAWSNRAGYRAGRDMQAIVHHIDTGEVGRNTINTAWL